MSIKDDFKPIVTPDTPESRDVYRKPTFAKVTKIPKANENKINFPKTFFGVMLIAAGVGCNYVGFLGWASNYLIEAGLTIAALGIGFKIKKGLDGKNVWQNEVNIIKSIFRKR